MIASSCISWSVTGDSYPHTANRIYYICVRSWKYWRVLSTRTFSSWPWPIIHLTPNGRYTGSRQWKHGSCVEKTKAAGGGGISIHGGNSPLRCHHNRHWGRTWGCSCISMWLSECRAMQWLGAYWWPLPVQCMVHIDLRLGWSVWLSLRHDVDDGHSSLNPQILKLFGFSWKTCNRWGCGRMALCHMEGEAETNEWGTGQVGIEIK